MKFSTKLLLFATIATLGVAHAQDQSLRGKASLYHSSSKSKGDSSSTSKGGSNGSSRDSSVYVADLGDYGKFTIYTDKDDSKMGWTVDLKNLYSLPVEGELTGLSYHLHSRWPQGAGSYSDDAAVCGGAGDHYDPYFACGPKSEQTNDVCSYIGREKEGEHYSCSPDIYDLKQYDKCEVGDLSGKYGSLTIHDDSASKDVRDDPFPALDYHYDGENEVLNPLKFASVVFHNIDGGDRVLCGKLVQIH